MRFAGSVNLRPVRMALLVSPDDMQAIRRFLRLCACVWGGRYNPIIPVFEETPERWLEWPTSTSGLDIARGYIDFFEPDLLVEASPGTADRLGWKHDGAAFDFARVISIGDAFEIDDRGRVDFAHAVDVLHLFADLYDNEFKFERRHKAPFALFNPHDDCGTFFEAVGGTYPNDEALKYILDGYQDVFNPEALPATAETFLKLMTEDYRGPHWVTRYGLEESLDRSRDPTFFVFDPTDGQDVIDFWNYRLFQRYVLPVNLHWFSECEDFLRDNIARTHRPLPGNPYGIMIHTCLAFGRSIEEETVRGITESHLGDLTKGSFYTTRNYEPIWDAVMSNDRWRTRKLVVTAKSVSFDEEIDQDGYVKIPAPAPEFHDKAETYSRSTWMNIVQPSGAMRDDRLATIFPSNLWNPGFPRLFSGDKLTITREGWSTPQQYDIGYSLVRPVNGRDAFIGWFKEQDIAALPSDAGQVADQVISAASSLLACGMFSDYDTIQLLNSMAESHSEPRRNQKTVERKSPDKTKPHKTIERHFTRREKHSWAFWTKLSYFLERSVFRAGLRVQCPNCSFYNWYDLKTLDYSLICDRCLKEFQFDQSPDHLKKIEWYYRVVGPFATPDFAQGGYAVALTLRRLAEESSRTELTWSTGLELQPLNAEIDFAVWYRRGNVGIEPEADEPILMVGEAKSFGADAIKQKDIDNLKRVGERLPGAFLVVSTLKEIANYSNDERALLRDFARWGRERRVNGRRRNPVIILTGAELLTDRHIKQVWEETGGKAADLVKHASVFLDDPYTLAERTQLLYLDLPSFDEDSRQVRIQRTRLAKLIKMRSEDGT